MKLTAIARQKTGWFAVSMTLAAGVFETAPAVSQTTKGTVVASPLEATTSSSQWASDLRYDTSQIYALSFAATGCPLVQVEIAGTKLWLLFDTGTARGFVLTDHAPLVPYTVHGRTEELNADGSHRGESLRIRVDSLSVLGKVFRSVSGTMSDWHIYSSEPFDGTVGLDFFRDRRVTLDYGSRKIGVTVLGIPEALDQRHYLVLDLITPPASQGSTLYVLAKVNGRDATVYFDTGTSVSFIDPSFAAGLKRVERSGRFPIFREHVPLEMGGRRLILDELREAPIRRGAGFNSPVALVLGSDILSHFIITIDLRSRKLILGVPR